jgi:hypothetical protein
MLTAGVDSLSRHVERRVVLAFCLALLYISIKFTYFSSYKTNEFKMWLGADETAFGALLGIVFDSLFGVWTAPFG